MIEHRLTRSACLLTSRVRRNEDAARDGRVVEEVFEADDRGPQRHGDVILRVNRRLLRRVAAGTELTEQRRIPRDILHRRGSLREDGVEERIALRGATQRVGLRCLEERDPLHDDDRRARAALRGEARRIVRVEGIVDGRAAVRVREVIVIDQLAEDDLGPEHRDDPLGDRQRQPRAGAQPAHGTTVGSKYAFCQTGSRPAPWPRCRAGS